MWTFWLKSRASQLPNGGFGLKIGPLLRELRLFKGCKVLSFETFLAISQLIIVRFSKFKNSLEAENFLYPPAWKPWVHDRVFVYTVAASLQYQQNSNFQVNSRLISVPDQVQFSITLLLSVSIDLKVRVLLVLKVRPWVHHRLKNACWVVSSLPVSVMWLQLMIKLTCTVSQEMMD